MVAVLLSIIASTALNMVGGFVAANYTYNISFTLLLVESLKLLVCSIGMRSISNKPHFQIRWEFIVNAFLYSIVNVLTHHINRVVPSAIYSVLIQHRILWVVAFSLLFLNQQYSNMQYMSVVLVLSGCILLKMTDTSTMSTTSITNDGLRLIVLQGICSSLSSVWIEKMMKREERPAASEDTKKQQLYWYLHDSFQMYMFGIPIYIVVNYTTEVTTVNIPVHWSCLMVVLHAVNGLCVGAMFVYYSSVMQSVAAAVVIVLLAIEHGVYTWNIVVGIVLVLVGAAGWS